MILICIKTFNPAHPLNPEFGDIEPMDGGKISGVDMETLTNWEKA